MKLIIIEKNADGSIRLDEEQLQKIVDDAYQQGKADAATPAIYSIYPSPPRPWWDSLPHITGTDYNKMGKGTGSLLRWEEK